MIEFDINLLLVPLALLFTLVWAYDYFIAKKYTYLPKFERAHKRAKKALPKHKRALAKAQKAHGLSLTDSELSSRMAHNDLPVPIVKAYQDYQKTCITLAQDAQAPALVRWSYDTWWIVIAIIAVRSWLIEPMMIPSSSMVPTLHTGDFILVNKFAYGLRLPIVNYEFLRIGRPAHGDVVVFRYPQNPRISYIKRVIGVGGDTVAMQNGALFVNGKPLELSEQSYTMRPNFVATLFPAVIESTQLSGEQRAQLGVQEESMARYSQEKLGVHTYLVRTLGIDASQYAPFLQSVSPNVVASGGKDWQVVVPNEQFFVMGDNRDRSQDARFWGFVEARHLAGRAEAVWAHKNAGLSLPNPLYFHFID